MSRREVDSAVGFARSRSTRPGRFLYAANSYGPVGTSGTVSGYDINAITGALTAIGGSPFGAETGPISIAVDPSDKFVYVAR